MNLAIEVSEIESGTAAGNRVIASLSNGLLRGKWPMEKDFHKRYNNF